MFSGIVEIDQVLTKWVYNNIGLNSNPIISKAPYYLGLVPYEIYVIPGMFVALILMFYYQSFTPMQIHLLPHWFAFSIGLYLKSHLQRVRPGCLENFGMDKLLDPGHCKGKTKFQSFPSGHTIVAFALAGALTMYLRDDTISDKVFMGIDFNQPRTKIATIIKMYIIAVMISLHRISYGYHHVGDVIMGAIIGSMIGFTTHTISNTVRNVYIDEKEPDETLWNIIRVIGSLFAVFAFIHFFAVDFSRLSALQH
jgi:membrane-associated phospholipid phosphatase